MLSARHDIKQNPDWRGVLHDDGDGDVRSLDRDVIKIVGDGDTEGAEQEAISEIAGGKLDALPAFCGDEQWEQYEQ